MTARNSTDDDDDGDGEEDSLQKLNILPGCPWLSATPEQWEKVQMQQQKKSQPGKCFIMFDASL